MPRDLTIVLPDRPGVGVRVCEVLAAAGINIEGTCGFPHRGETWGVFHLLLDDPVAARKVIEDAGFEIVNEREVLVLELEDRPGALAEVLRTLADAEVNIDLIYLATNTRLVIGTDDMHEARTGVRTLDAKYIP